MPLYVPILWFINDGNRAAIAPTTVSRPVDEALLRQDVCLAWVKALSHQAWHVLGLDTEEGYPSRIPWRMMLRIWAHHEQHIGFSRPTQKFGPFRAAGFSLVRRQVIGCAVRRQGLVRVACIPRWWMHLRWHVCREYPRPREFDYRLRYRTREDQEDWSLQQAYIASSLEGERIGLS